MSQDPNTNNPQYQLENKQLTNNHTDFAQKPSAGENVTIANELKVIKKVLGYSHTSIEANVDHNNVRQYLQNIMLVLGYPGISNSSIVVSLQQRLENIEKKIPNNITIDIKTDVETVIKSYHKNLLYPLLDDTIISKINTVFYHCTKEGDLYKKINHLSSVINTNFQTVNDKFNTYNKNSYKLNNDIYEIIKNVNFATKGEYSQTFQNISNYLANQIPNLKTFNDSINNITLKFDNLATKQQATQITTVVSEIKTTLNQQYQVTVSQIKSQVDSSLNQSTQKLTDDISKITQSVNTNLSTLNSTLQKSASAIELEKTQGLINRDVVAPLKQLNDKQSEFNNTQQSILNILDERLRKPVEHANPDEETILEMADYGVRILEELTSMARSYAKNKDTINGNQQQIQQTKQQLETEKQNAIKQAQREVVQNYLDCNKNYDLDTLLSMSQHQAFLSQYLSCHSNLKKGEMLTVTNDLADYINNGFSIIGKNVQVTNSCVCWVNDLDTDNKFKFRAQVKVLENNPVTKSNNNLSSLDNSSDNLGY